MLTKSSLQQETSATKDMAFNTAPVNCLEAIQMIFTDTSTANRILLLQDAFRLYFTKFQWTIS